MTTNVIWANREAELTGEYESGSILDKIKEALTTINDFMESAFLTTNMEVLDPKYRNGMSVDERATIDRVMNGIGR